MFHIQRLKKGVGEKRALVEAAAAFFAGVQWNWNDDNI